MGRPLRLHHRARTLVAAGVLLIGSGAACATDVFDGRNLTIPSITIGNATYSNVVVAVGDIVSGPTGTTPGTELDTYDPGSNRLSIPAVSFRNNTYYNVVITVGGLVSIGAVTGADTYDGKDLVIPAVQVPGGSIYTNVVVTVSSVISTGGGMPRTTLDVYDPASHELTISSGTYAGQVFTNVIVTVGKVVAESLPASVSISAVAPPTAGDFVQLSAVVKDAAGNILAGQPVAWSTDDPAVATVTATGLLMALGAGTANITATAGSSRASLATTVAANGQVMPGKVLFSLGPEETVYDYATQHCSTGYATPDEPAHAIRLSDDSIELFTANYPLNFAYRGADFHSLAISCTPVLTSVDNTQPQSFENDQWISGVYYQNGVVYALIHNEFHDSLAPTCKPGDSSPDNPCWYNSVALASSADNGHSFTLPSSYVVAPPGSVWTPPTSQPSPSAGYFLMGYFNPSNIVSGNDGYFYAMIYSKPKPDSSGNEIGECVMRTANLADASAWRAWDGSGYNAAFADPYTAGAAPVGCQVVIPGYLVESVTYNSYLGNYVAIGGSCGDWYSISGDLVNWTPITQFKANYNASGVGSNPCPPPAGQLPEAYPSLIDHDSPSPNFDVSGQTVYLYHSRWTQDWITGSQDRDLVRQPVILLKSPVSGADFTAPTANWEFTPSTTTPVTGSVTLYPWAFDPTGIRSVQILLDGTPIGTATGGFPRPDIVAVYPAAPLNCGYQFVFNSTLFSHGAHTLTAIVTDNAQITTTLQAPIIIS